MVKGHCQGKRSCSVLAAVTKEQKAQLTQHDMSVGVQGWLLELMNARAQRELALTGDGNVVAARRAAVAVGRLQAHTSTSSAAEISRGPDYSPCFRNFQAAVRAPVQLGTL